MRILAVFTALFALLTGCGGGGGSSHTSPSPENNLPVAVEDSVTTTVDTAVDIDVLANDSDPDGDPLTVTEVIQASNGTVSINDAGTVHYVPIAGFTGKDTFTYSINDGRNGTATAMVSVAVSFPGGELIERVSIATDGSQGNFSSWMGFSSSDGRYVVFHSGATNLFPGATSGDILMRDRLASRTALVSSDLTGTPGNLSSQQPAISGDDRFVTFSSFASNLVPGDTNGEPDVFIKDLQAGAIERISVDSSGNQGNGGSFAPSISSDGRYVAFVSMASNFFPGDSQSSWDIFIRDRQSGQTEHVGSGGNFDNGPSISGEGRLVAFPSSGQVFVYDRQTGQSSIVSVAADGTPGNNASDYPSFSEDGRYVAFTSVATNLLPGDTNGVRDVFVRDIQTGTTTRVSVASNGVEGNAPVSDLEKPGISGNGRFVAFTSAATNLVSDDFSGFSDAFIHDMATGQTRRVSVSSGGMEANGESGDSVLVSVSSNGNYVVFASAASNLVSGDTNNFGDVFIAPNPFVQ